MMGKLKSLIKVANDINEYAAELEEGDPSLVVQENQNKMFNPALAG